MLSVQPTYAAGQVSHVIYYCTQCINRATLNANRRLEVTLQK